MDKEMQNVTSKNNQTEAGEAREQANTPQIDTSEVPFGLKLLVIGLGVAIVIMIALIMGKIMLGDSKKDAGDTGQQGTRPSITAQAVAVQTDEYPLLKLADYAPQEGKLISLNVSGDTLILHYQVKEQSVWRLIDRKTGAVQHIE